MTDYADTINAAARSWNVDPTLLSALIEQESNYNPQAKSSAGAVGLTQLMPDTAKGLGVTDLTDPMQQIYGGAKYLSEALNASKSPEEALLYYHGGPDWQSNFGPESAAFPGAVTKRYLALKKASTPATVAQTDPFTAALNAGGNKGGVPSVAAHDPFTQALQAPTKNPVSADATPTPAVPPEEPTSTIGQIGAGLIRAGHDLTDVPAEYLAKASDAIGLTGLLNRAGITTPTASETAAADKIGLDQYNTQYGNSTPATIARVGGQVAGTLPLLSSGGALLGGVGDMAAAGAGRVAPWAGRALEGAQNFLAGDTGTGLLGRGASLAANGALQGGGAAALTAGQNPGESVGDQALSGAVTGGIAGPAFGALGGTLKTIGNLTTGSVGGAAPEMAALAQKARDVYGIPITAPQLSGNPLLRTINEQSARLPFSGAGAVGDVQQKAWQRAVTRTFGEDSDLVTPNVMDQAAKRIGSVFNGVADRTKINVDEPLLDTLSQIETEAASSPLGTGGTDAIKKQIDNILGAGEAGTIDGKAYQQLTRTGAPLQRAQSAADPNVRYYAGQIRDALDDAFQRSAAPEDQAALATARKQYRNMKTVEDLVEKSGDGNISPALLMGQVRSASSRFDPSVGGMAYTGGGELGDLARIGQMFLKPQPNSGTADRLMINALVGAPGAIGGYFINPLAAAAIPAGWAANNLMRKGLQSGWYARNAINSSLNPSTNPLLPRMIPYAAPLTVIGRGALTGP